MRLLLLAALLLTLLTLILAAMPLARGWLSAAVIPPPPPAEPVKVYLLKHGRHSSLVLPGETGWVRFSYGDWAWYALRQTGLTSGLAALFTPTQAALGRGELAGEAVFDPKQLGVTVDEVHELRVEAEAAARLRRELEARFTAAETTRIHTPQLNMDLVHHPVPYTLGHNSNRMVGDWLTALGCEIRGVAVLADWRVEAPDIPTS